MQILKRTIAAFATLCLASIAAFAAPFAYIPTPRDGTVTVVDLATNSVARTIRVGDWPVGVALNPAGTRLYIANNDSASISVVDTATNSVTSTIPISPAPLGLAINGTGTRMAVTTPGNGSVSGNTIAVIDLSSNAVLGRASVGNGPTGVVFNAAGTRLYTADYESGTVSVVDAASLALLATIRVGAGPLELAIDAATSRVYVTHIGTSAQPGNVISVINTSSNTLERVIPVGFVPFGIAINPAGSRVFVANNSGNSVSVVNASTNSVAATIPVSPEPNSVALNADGTRLSVLSARDGALVTYDATTLAPVGSATVPAGSLALGKFVGGPAQVAAANRSDMWWNPNESGWGLAIMDHETQLFVVWYTFAQDGSPTWFVVPSGTLTEGRRIFEGDLYETRGPAYSAATFNPSAVTATRVGSVRLDFAPPFATAGAATFAYTVGNVSGTKQIQRQQFGNSAPEWGTDLTDIWWNPDESGWGFTLSQHGNQMFGAWFTYGVDGRPLWVVLPGGSFDASGAFSGSIYTVTGPYFGSPVFNPASVRVTPEGDATLSIRTEPLFAKVPGRRTGTLRTRFRNQVQFRTFQPMSFGVSPVVDISGASQYSVTVTTSGFGTITSTPAGISCGTRCTAAFPAGSSVTLTAVPNQGWSFSRWEGACSGTGACVLSMTQQRAVTAVFANGAPPTGGTICTGLASLTVTGSLSAPEFGCAGLLPYSTSSDITIRIPDFSAVGDQPSVIEMSRARFFCQQNGNARSVGVDRDLFAPTITLSRDATGQLAGTGRSSSTAIQDDFQINFQIPNGQALSGSISRTYSLSGSVRWQWTGTFSCPVH